MSNDASDQVGHRSIQNQISVQERSPVDAPIPAPEPKLPFAFARNFGVVLVFDEQGENPQACAKSQLSLSTLAEIRRYTQQHVRFGSSLRKTLMNCSVLRTREIPAKQSRWWKIWVTRWILPVWPVPCLKPRICLNSKMTRRLSVDQRLALSGHT